MYIQLNHLKKIKRFFLFIVTGLIAIIVGAFMIRGNMHMWDKDSDD